MKVGVPKESVAGERRVALIPEAARALVKANLQVAVEAGAGASAFFGDAAYIDAGANVTDATTALGSDAVLKVQPPPLDEVSRLRGGAVLISFLQPATNADVVSALAKQKVSAFSLDLVPRISRAQSMDALSSQAGIAGYKSVLIAANHLPKFFPLLMTAAGTGGAGCRRSRRRAGGARWWRPTTCGRPSRTRSTASAPPFWSCRSRPRRAPAATRASNRRTSFAASAS